MRRKHAPARSIGDERAGPENAALFAAIVASSDDAILSTDLDGNILSWNPGAERMFGFSAAEVVRPAFARHERLEVARELRSRPSTARSCIVILTAMDARTLHAFDANERGVNAFICKPITMEAVRTLLDALGR